jgi:hypothetical protein
MYDSPKSKRLVLARSLTVMLVLLPKQPKIDHDYDVLVVVDCNKLCYLYDSNFYLMVVNENDC